MKVEVEMGMSEGERREMKLFYVLYYSLDSYNAI